MKIYIAGTFTERLRLREVADRLWHMGFEIVSTWLTESARPDYMTHKEFFRKLGEKDFQEITAADLLILDTKERSEGKHVELGFALAANQRKIVWIVGEARSVFHELADKVFPTWDACTSALEDFRSET